MMRRITSVLLGAGMAFGCIPAYTNGVSFAGNAKTQIGAFVYGANAGTFSAAKETLSLSLDARGFGCSLFADGAMQFDALAAHFEQPFSVKNGIGGTLREAWFDWTSPSFSLANLNFSIKAGRQINAWGKADGISIADVLCPKDMGVLSASNYSEARLGVDALKLSLSGELFSAETYWIPVFRPSVLPLAPGNPLRSALLPENIPALPPIKSPEAELKNSSYAARLDFHIPAADFSFYGFYGWDSDNALLTLMTGKYFRMAMAAFDAAIPLGEFVLRAETAFFPNRAFELHKDKIFTDGRTHLTMHQIRALAGIDWFKGDWIINAQYYGDLVFIPDEAMNRHPYDHGSTLSIARSFIGETLKITLSAAADWNDLDSYAGLSATYALTDQLKLTAGADGYFNGVKRNGRYGSIAALSNVRLEAVFSF